MRKFSIITILTLLSFTNFAQTNTYFGEVEAWNDERIAALKQPDGWLNLEGLFWLKKGVNSFGSASVNDFKLTTFKNDFEQKNSLKKN